MYSKIWEGNLKYSYEKMNCNLFIHFTIKIIAQKKNKKHIILFIIYITYIMKAIIYEYI